MTESVGLTAALESLGELLAAYKKRNAELEQIVATQQARLDARETNGEVVAVERTVDRLPKR